MFTPEMPTPIDPRVALENLTRYVDEARAALADEHEGAFTEAVHRIANTGRNLEHLVNNW